jgi:hypothetical protein
MQWFRANRGLGGRLALFALAVQFTLSFGHIHAEDIFGPASAAAPAAVTVPAADQSRPLAPDRHSSQSDDYCAICASMYLLGSSAVPDVPQLLPLPSVVQPAEHVTPVAAIFVAPQRAPFQSRAPPAA